MNSFIGWIGGKRALRNEILQRMPADIGRYIEVFGGAGWVLFGREPSSKVMEVFNDYDAELVNIYRCIKYHPDALQHELDLLPDAREVFFDYLAQEQVRRPFPPTTMNWRSASVTSTWIAFAKLSTVM